MAPETGRGFRKRDDGSHRDCRRGILNEQTSTTVSGRRSGGERGIRDKGGLTNDPLFQGLYSL